MDENRQGISFFSRPRHSQPLVAAERKKRDREETKEEEERTARVVVFARHVVLQDSLYRV